MNSTFTNLFTLWDSQFLTEMLRISVPIAEKVIRPILVYIALVALLRVFGKRELAQLNPFDLVVLLCLSNTVQNSIIGNDNSVTGGLIGAVTLLATNYLVVRFLFRHRRLDQFIQGTPTVLIDRGKIQLKNLARELMTEIELIAVIHRHGFVSISDVDSCVLEPNGTFFMKGKDPPLRDVRHKEVLDRLEALSRQVEGLRKLIAAQEPGKHG